MADTATLSYIRELVKDDLAQLNYTIHQSLHSSIENINSISQHITANQGKRLRPLLTLLCARACGYEGNDHVQLAAVIELIHTATLLHDDVVDESTQRRGKITANAKWGNPISVLVGDFLYSRSFQGMAKLNHTTVFKVLADTTNIIAEGEVLQLTHSCQPHLAEATYLRVIHHKTAQLFESACQLSAVIANQSESTQQALQSYGKHLGMAYQLIDDILDYTGDTTLGKNRGDDFREGKVTLPLIIALQQASEYKAAFERHIQGEQPMAFEQALAIMQQHDCFEKPLALAKARANQAQICLKALPASDYREALAQLLTFIIHRAY